MKGEVETQFLLFGLLLHTQPLHSSEQHIRAHLEFSSHFGIFRGSQDFGAQGIFVKKLLNFVSIRHFDLTQLRPAAVVIDLHTKEKLRSCRKKKVLHS